MGLRNVYLCPWCSITTYWLVLLYVMTGCCLLGADEPGSWVESRVYATVPCGIPMGNLPQGHPKILGNPAEKAFRLNPEKGTEYLTGESGCW